VIRYGGNFSAWTWALLVMGNSMSARPIAIGYIARPQQKTANTFPIAPLLPEEH
jgi:hypothetical protein